MIVYQNGDYCFINYKDQVDSLTPLYKINKITQQHIDTPDLGANFVKVNANGEVLTAGGPKPGGKILLQKDYVAVIYQDSSNAFEVLQSQSYKYCEAYDQLHMAKHMCTDYARALDCSPNFITFVPGGTLSVLPDIEVDGIQADYVALKSGVPIGYFGVKKQSYYGLPFPTDCDYLKIAALAKNILDRGGTTFNVTGEPVDGLLSLSQIKGHINSLRAAMASYERLQVDYSLVTSFKIPVSTSLLTDGTVLSVLDVENTRNYINDQGPGDHSNLIAGLIFDELAFQHFVINGFEGSNMIEFLNSAKIPPSCVVLLASDFNNILMYYKLVYDRKRAEVTVSSIEKMKVELTNLIEKMSKSGSTYAIQYLRQKLAEVMALNIGEVSAMVSVSLKSSRLESLRLQDLSYTDDNVSEKVPIFTEQCKSTIKEFGQDSVMDLSNIGEANKIDFFNVDNFGDKSFNCARAKTTVKEVIDATVQNLNCSVVIPGLDVSITLNDCRAWCIHHKDSLNIKAFLGRGFNASPIRMRIFDDRFEIDVRYTSNGVDSDIKDYIGGTFNQLKQMVRDHFAGNFLVNFSSGLCFDGPLIQGWNASCRRGESPAYHGIKKTPVHAFFDVTLVKTFNIKLTNLPLCSVDSVSNIFDIDVVAKNAYADNLSQKFESAVNKYAADCAYEICKPLFNSCKDSYAYRAIGSIGNSLQGLVVSLNDIAKITSIDEHYVTTLKGLISGIPDEELKKSMQSFVNDLDIIKSNCHSVEPIFYLDEASVKSAEPESNPKALVHYLYGGV